MTTVSLTIQNNKFRLIMKELSIEGKAKAYDEAIKRAREWYNELEPDSYTCVVESIFPEFKERSKNERIRKEIISILKGEVGYTSKEDTDRYIAWLKKQDETPEVDGTFVNIDDVREYFMQEIYRILDADPTNDRANQIIDVFDSLPTVKLKKRGELNPYSGVSFKYNGHTWGMCARDNGVEILVDGKIKERVFLDSKPQGKSALEAINEEKVDNANKVEPKFKVGDWITNGVYTCKIVEVIDNSYKYTFTEGASYFGVIDDMDKEYRLWTIDDAKAGDILAAEDVVFIFKHIDKTRLWLCNSYCEVIGNSKLGLGFDFSIDGVNPATKEQRELLYSKIKEADYKWNVEKLELKKIKPEFWSDDENKRFNGFKIAHGEVQNADDFYNLPNAYHIFATEKQAKSALAMARISQIMDNDVENFGGVITDEEWQNDEWKFVIHRGDNRIKTDTVLSVYSFLAFHTAEQRDLFLEKYPQLVKDYLMISEE